MKTQRCNTYYNKAEPLFFKGDSCKHMLLNNDLRFLLLTLKGIYIHELPKNCQNPKPQQPPKDEALVTKMEVVISSNESPVDVIDL